MKMALFGATGMIGSRILKEALSRGHQVSALSRNGSKDVAGANVISCDVLKPDDVAHIAADHDVVISAFGPGQGNPGLIVDAARSLLAGLKGTLKHLVVVGGAGSLEVAPGVELVDTPEFPEAWRALALAHRDALMVFLGNSDVQWSYATPAALIEPGERTGHFRMGMNQLIVDERGQSRISAEDFAIAVVDEAENPQYVHGRFTVGY